MRLETSKSSADQNKFCIFWFLFSLNIHVTKKIESISKQAREGLIHLHSLAEFLSYAQDLCSPSQRSQDHWQTSLQEDDHHIYLKESNNKNKWINK